MILGLVVSPPFNLVELTEIYLDLEEELEKFQELLKGISCEDINFR
jgi:hypothetical protein